MSAARPFVIDPQAKTQKQKSLIDTEKDLINKLNKSGDKETKINTILDQSINDIFTDYSKRMAIVVEDVVNVVNDKDFKENSRTHNYIGVFLNLITSVFDIMTKPDNIIYSGFTMIFISIFIYYLFIAS
jgi:hypothetical protein|tara:strand:+ start:41 stop:427 length:387 start_codon:yes stop_codon:yes gene_type:complete